MSLDQKEGEEFTPYPQTQLDPEFNNFPVIFKCRQMRETGGEKNLRKLETVPALKVTNSSKVLNKGADWLKENHPDVYRACLKVAMDQSLTFGDYTEDEQNGLVTSTRVGRYFHVFAHAYWLMQNAEDPEAKELADEMIV